MPPAIIAAAVGGAAALGSAAISKSAAKKATNAATEATNANNALAKSMYDTTRSDLQPYTQGGYQANNALLNSLGLGSGAQTPQRIPNYTGRAQPVRYTQPRPAAQPMAQPSPMGTSAGGESPPLTALQEGHVTTFANGQKWALQGGQPMKVG